MSLHKKIIGTAVALVSVVALLAFAPAASADSKGPYLILPWSGVGTGPGQHNMCVEVQGGSTASSARIQQYTCLGGKNTNLHQQWRIDNTVTQSGYVHIVNVKSGLCMNVQGGSTANSAAVIQYRCQTSASINDQWAVDYYTDNGDLVWYTIRNRGSQKCLNVQGGSDAPGVKMIQYTCSDSYNNIFVLQTPSA